MVRVKLTGQTDDEAINATDDDLMRSQLFATMYHYYGDNYVLEIPNKFAPAYPLYCTYLLDRKFKKQETGISTDILWWSFELSNFMEDVKFEAWLVTTVILKHWSDTGNMVKSMLSVDDDNDNNSNNTTANINVNIDAIRYSLARYLPYLEIPICLRYRPDFLKSWVDFNLDTEIKVTTVVSQDQDKGKDKDKDKDKDKNNESITMCTLYTLHVRTGYCDTSFEVKVKFRQSDDKKPSNAQQHQLTFAIHSNLADDDDDDNYCHDGGLTGYRISFEEIYVIPNHRQYNREYNSGVRSFKSWWISGLKREETNYHLDTNGNRILHKEQWSNEISDVATPNTTADNIPNSVYLASLNVTGRQRVISTAVNSCLHGDYLITTPNGKKITKGRYNLGTKIGVWTIEDADGNIIETLVMDNSVSNDQILILT